MSAIEGRIFEEDTEPRSDWVLPKSPPWREFGAERGEIKGRTYRASSLEVDMVNAAIYLRRPLLVTGPPGVGKTSLAYAVARQLMLGEVLVWPINTRSTLKEGLYDYDAIARVQDASLPEGSDDRDRAADVGRYLKLNALGTAFMGRSDGKPRVLLVDEIDKSDIDLPNDLLNIFEEGEFKIRELSRLTGETRVAVETADGGRSEIVNGHVSCATFPLVFLTSNGEREFPPAFLRRCLRLDIPPPDESRLREIVKEHLGHKGNSATVDSVIESFLAARDGRKEVLATDQLLNAVFLVVHGADKADRDLLRQQLLRPLAESR